ncbi:MAG: oligopeptide:H+ symporter [Rhodanobacter sp.]
MSAAPRAGQTRSFVTILLLELWERFGYYGMAGLLVLFMVQKFGIDDARVNLMWGAFTALAFATPAIGGWVGDKVLGAKRTMTFGAFTLALGYLLLASSGDSLHGVYIALGTIVVGNGLFKANAANIVRRIYESEDAKIDSAFTLYYMANNIAGMVSVLLMPWIKDHWGWHVAFATSCVGMVLGLMGYFAMMRTLADAGSPPDAQPLHWDRLAMVLGGSVVSLFVVAFVMQHSDIAISGVYAGGMATLGIFGYMIANGTKSERAGLIAALILVAEALLFYIFYQQVATSLTLFALRNVDWNQTLYGQHLFTWSPAQYPALNAIWILLLSPPLAWIYHHLGKRGLDLSVAAKFAIGFAAVAVAFFIFGMSKHGAVNGKVSSWFMIAGYGVYSLGELLIAALGLAMISRYVPARMSGFMMGAFFVAAGIAEFLGSVIASSASIPEHNADPLVSLAIYTRLFNQLGLLAIGGMVLAILLLPLMRRLSALHVASKA